MNVYDPYSSGGDMGLTARPASQNSAWMVIMADLFSLLLTFFVMLYSMSVLISDQWEAASESLMQRVQQPYGQQLAVVPDKWHVPRANFTYARGLDYLSKVIAERLQTLEDMDGVVITRGHDHITISLSSDDMFRSGSVDIEPQAREKLWLIGQFLANIGNAVRIDGHTDPQPIYTPSYPSNWELSMARAVTVANVLRASGYPYAVDIHGMGSSRYGELADLPEAERDKLARRVDIIVRETVAKH